MKKLLSILILLISITCNGQEQIFSIKDSLYTQYHNLFINYNAKHLIIYDNTINKSVINTDIKYIGTKLKCKYYTDKYGNKISINFDATNHLYCIIIEKENNILIIYP